MQNQTSLPLVSIITPNYNGGLYLRDMMNSVINQSYEQWVLYIIDNGSQDESVELIKEFAQKDSRIIPYFFDEKLGVAKARNYGIEKSKGDYIAFLDSDDLWQPDKLEKQVSYLESNANVDLLYSSFCYMNKEGKLTSSKVKIPLKANYNSLLKHNYIATLTVILRKKILPDPVFKAVGHEDFVLWLSLLKNGAKAEGMSPALAYYRVIPGSLSRNKIKGLSWVWNIYRNIEGINLFKSCYLILNITLRSMFKKLRAK